MPIYKKPEDKAAETVTIRLTGDERRMLDHLASLDEMTLTDFLRSRIAERARELGVSEPPPRQEKRRPGRPKMKPPIPSAEETKAPSISNRPFAAVAETSEPRPAADVSVPAPSLSSMPPTSSPPPASSISVPPSVEAVIPSMPGVPHYSMVSETAAPAYFGDLVIRFRNSFVHRAEGTKRELEETILFLCRETGDGPIVPITLPLSELTSERLAEIRSAVRDADVRLAKKNLYLTYLRMMLHFAVKEPDIDLRINPSRELPALSIVESEERRRFFIGRPE